MAAAASASVYIVICVVAALKYPATSLAIPTTRCLAAGDSPEAICAPMHSTTAAEWFTASSIVRSLTA
ncbi:hypothetical protein PF005_g24432 [Phytophthora fragariae]|uniref:Secreted protein n=1 Tax=Phytophthora fragariae TaxID=53985 RepID=A0A6A3PC85_9STRA|nr:hypothetical protein PF003_g10089 [Phytophthora fragariae]KAE8906392.1 hypothetical protein PF003_g10080 [Phytophthora fragariae]KAE8918980.1 hypothetical protein PF009_g30707 [Phytophthora fragariae]KAE8960040.1 hypothetical protein PF011_g30227 [Phytophthora fragariae]KAE9054252.1 hypothetical protein PF010_g32614 [Phytophthora fragariae]